MTVQEAIERADAILPGKSVPAGTDPRWQSIIEVGEFILSEPDAVWTFAARWGCHSDPDLRAAIATCLLEHLLEHHFGRLFPHVERLALTDKRFADTFLQCWSFGQSTSLTNDPRLRALRERLLGPSAA